MCILRDYSTGDRSLRRRGILAKGKVGAKVVLIKEI